MKLSADVFAENYTNIVMEGRTMSVERNLSVVRERKLAILKGDPDLCAKQKKAGKLLGARARGAAF